MEATLKKIKKVKAPVSLETNVVSQAGKKGAAITLPEAIFGVPWNGDLVHQVMVSMNSNARAGTAHTKNRGEVRGGGKKPWQQKGTGRARHGSSRSPIWVGGGITHGPRTDKDYTKKINRKMKAKALFTVLSQKYRDGEILFIDDLTVASTKTKDAGKVIASLAAQQGFEKLLKARKQVGLVAVPKDTYANVARAYRNLPQVLLNTVEELDITDVLNHRYLIISQPENAIALLAKKQVSKKATA